MQSPEMVKSPEMASVRGRSRRLVLVVAVAALVSALLAPAVSAQGSSGGFGDVPADTYYSDAVALLAADGVFAGTGCAEGFCPGEVIDRKTMAVWLVRILDGTDPAAVTASRFDDVDASGFHAAFIERMADLEVTRGCGDLSGFCPHRAVTRAQMAVFLSRAFDLADGPDPGFGDVAADAWYRADVARLAASGITVGCGDGSNFCPGRDTTRAQMATFLARATGKIPTPERATPAPAVLLSFTSPDAVAGSTALPSPDWRHVAYLANLTGGYYDANGQVGDLYVAARDGSNLTKVASDVRGGRACGDGWCDIPAAVWSPDGSRFWYVTIAARDDQGEATSFSLSVAAADGTGSVHLTRDGPPIDRAYGDYDYHGWSPDSQHLAYITEGTDSGLFVARADGANPTRLIDGYSAWSDVAWSPDSRHIAYIIPSSDRALFVARADGTNPTVLAEGFVSRSVAWSPDGQHIAYVIDGFDGGLFVAAADGTNPTRVVDGSPSFYWSPDGSRIAYVARGDYDDELFRYRYGLFTVSADGSGTTKLAQDVETGYSFNPQWSPDSRHIAYATDQAGLTPLFTARADGSGSAKLADDASATPVWSPDGRHIAYSPVEQEVRDDGSTTRVLPLFTARADGSSETRLAEDIGSAYGPPPVWSPDSSHIAYMAEDSDLFTARVDGSNVTKLSDNAYRVFVWSPDSTRLAYLTFELGQEPEDYDPDDPGTWPYYRASVEVSGTDGASIARLATPYSVHPLWRGCNALALTWRPDGIEFDVEYADRC